MVFTVFPAALARLPGKQLWSALFFFTLLLLGLDSAFAMVEVRGQGKKKDKKRGQGRQVELA